MLTCAALTVEQHSTARSGSAYLARTRRNTNWPKRPAVASRGDARSLLPPPARAARTRRGASCCHHRRRRVGDLARRCTRNRQSAHDGGGSAKMRAKRAAHTFTMAAAETAALRDAGVGSVSLLARRPAAWRADAAPWAPAYAAGAAALARAPAGLRLAPAVGVAGARGQLPPGPHGLAQRMPSTWPGRVPSQQALLERLRRADGHFDASEMGLLFPSRVVGGSAPRTKHATGWLALPTPIHIRVP